jgi:hypothetical protein
MGPDWFGTSATLAVVVIGEPDPVARSHRVDRAQLRQCHRLRVDLSRDRSPDSAAGWEAPDALDLRTRSQKACACLIRLALEQALNAYWQAANPAVAEWGNGRIALLLLRRRVPCDIARQASFTWVSLSRATHHHGYEAAIAAGELRRLHDNVQAVIRVLC